MAGFYAQIGVTKFDDFEVEVVDPVGDYKALLKEVCPSGTIITIRASYHRPRNRQDGSSADVERGCHA